MRWEGGFRTTVGSGPRLREGICCCQLRWEDRGRDSLKEGQGLGCGHTELEMPVFCDSLVKTFPWLPSGSGQNPNSTVTTRPCVTRLQPSDFLFCQQEKLVPTIGIICWLFLRLQVLAHPLNSLPSPLAVPLQTLQAVAQILPPREDFPGASG